MNPQPPMFDKALRAAAKGSTTMLAELFMLRLEARLRTSREPTSFTKSDTRFIPIKQPNPEKEEKPQTDK
jgi:hypothetical protein